MNYDVFNGDADGIIALLQLRLAEPRNAQLVTGVKRDINLLAKLDTRSLDAQSEVTVLDISMEKNADALAAILTRSAQVFYADHHRPGQIPECDNLSAHIDISADTCTALIIDKYLAGKHHYWGITGAYGDNLIAVADDLAAKAGLTAEQAAELRELGTLINYNGYGSAIEDLHYHPADLYRALLAFENPFDCITADSSPFHVLKAAYEEDFNNAEQGERIFEDDKVTVMLMPDEAWSRRISGTYGNYLANQSPDKAHIVLTTIDAEHYLVSLRAPLNNKTGAGDICASFETGGGRAGAAGINKLPKGEIDTLIEKVKGFY